MELGPIFRALLRNKIRFLLIGAEVALTLAIVVNSVSMMQDMRERIIRPTGLDEAGIIVVLNQPFSSDYREDGYFDVNRKADLELLRSLSGVRNAEAISAVPLSGSGSSTGVKPLGSEMNTIGTAVFTTGPDALETLGVRLIAGRDLNLDDINDSDAKNVIITKALADRLFPDGNALGQRLQGREPENPDTVVGILELMHGSWPGWQYVTHVTLRPGEPGSFNWGVRYLVRTDPSKISDLMPEIERRLLERNDGRNVTLETLAEIKARTFEAELAVSKMLGVVITLLVLVTAVGIVGITSFAVTERIHHIGTRRALGARRRDILRYFLTENWIITATGIVAGAALAFGLNLLLVNLTDGVALDWGLLAAGGAGMWVIGTLAAFFPAWKGAQVSPATATRNV